MLKVTSQGIVSSGYEIELTTGRRLHIHTPTPTNAQISGVMLDHERRVLDDINIGGEEQEEYPVIEFEPIGITI